MSGKVVVSAAALLATLAAAANVNVHNQCSFDVQITPSTEGTDQGQQTIKAGDTFTRPATGSAWCLKMYGPGATNPTQLEWSVWGANTLSYDLSDIDMHSDTTFLQYGMSLTSEDPTCNSPNSNCKPAICAPTKNPSNTPCQDAYNQPFDPRTLGASANYDINMVLCTGNSGGSQTPQKQEAPPAPAAPPVSPSPSPSPQPVNNSPAGNPVHVDANGNAYEGNDVVNVVQTQVVTQIVTARDAEATAPIMRRHIHHPHGHHY